MIHSYSILTTSMLHNFVLTIKKKMLCQSTPSTSLALAFLPRLVTLSKWIPLITSFWMDSCGGFLSKQSRMTLPWHIPLALSEFFIMSCNTKQDWQIFLHYPSLKCQGNLKDSKHFKLLHQSLMTMGKMVCVQKLFL